MRLLRFLPTYPWSPRAWRQWVQFMRWRLETFGVYYPDGKWNWAGFRMLLRQGPSYFRWLGQFEALRRKDWQQWN